MHGRVFSSPRANHMARRGRLGEQLIYHVTCEEHWTIVCLYYEPEGGRPVIWGDTVHAEKRGSGYVRVGLRPLFQHESHRLRHTTI